jgi:hypothetical protein
VNELRQKKFLPRESWGVLFCLLFTLYTAVIPFVRSFFLVELSYNEGWNVYNVERVVNHQWLYPEAHGWTTNNYPALSFFVLATLHRWTHDYLFTARMLSLLSVLGCSVLTALIVRRLTGAGRPALLAGLYCMALFCTKANIYVGMDDPQMFAQVFFLAGLFVYVCNRRSYTAIGFASLLFVTGGCVKHNLIDFPLTVLIDLCFLSRIRALWFALCGLLFVGVAILLNIHFGGPYFLSQLLAPRLYDLSRSFGMLVDVLGPELLPIAAAVYMAIKVRNNPELRIAAILLTTSLGLGTYFIGGHGVWINAYFSCFMATSILLGLFFDAIPAIEPRWTRGYLEKWAAPVLFFWLMIPLIMLGNVNPVVGLEESASAQARFQQQVALMRSQPGPEICESLLRCYFAGKPFLYDGFNTTRMIEFGKLKEDVIINRIRDGQYGAIQLDGDMKREMKLERFTPGILAAIQQNYFVRMQDQDVVIFFPISNRLPVPSGSAEQNLVGRIK